MKLMSIEFRSKQAKKGIIKRRKNNVQIEEVYERMEKKQNSLNTNAEALFKLIINLLARGEC